MSVLRKSIEHAVEEAKLLSTSASNILQLLTQDNDPVHYSAVEELVSQNAWAELNDRFFKTLTFGTGGLRGRTIGKMVTTAERGSRDQNQRPEFPCVGTNAMNFYNIKRATKGLAGYLTNFYSSQESLPANNSSRPKPSLVIAHDTRFFSREFAELAAKTAVENGCDVFLFQEARSTPQLSFAVRYTNSTAGIVITASHNPPHDNGFKVYFSDGAQIVEPHASGIIKQINDRSGERSLNFPADKQGKLVTCDLDEPYKKRLRTLFLRPDLPKDNLKIVFTPIHGTGGAITLPLLRDSGFQIVTVAEQNDPDGSFPTVQSPNPENAEALSMGIRLAEKEGADLVIGTDPDADRMGIAFRNRRGKMELLSGNQIGSLIIYYRIKTLKELGIINDENKGHGGIVKTLVTTDLQKAIAEKEGVRCVETLTGFKYIGQKLGKYEAALPKTVRSRYRELSEEETRSSRLQYSVYFVAGGEESYGFSGADFVRDKDANSASLMFVELAAFVKAQGLTLDSFLDQIFLEYGYYAERSESFVFEGAEGADKIRRVAESYRRQPPSEMDGSAVIAATDFFDDGIRDSENDLLPAEKMMIFALADDRRIAVRPSGTEPKIKFYLFGKRSEVTLEHLSATKDEVAGALESLWKWLQQDVTARVA
ncbi:MAG: phospho-sugar mutase [Verrucomicrobia bacterium]|nr:phospho-sugar mutase [Verrucomicrobiota bacterium]